MSRTVESLTHDVSIPFNQVVILFERIWQAESAPPDRPAASARLRLGERGCRANARAAGDGAGVRVQSP